MFDIIDLSVAVGVGGCIGAAITLLGVRGKLVENAGILEDCEEHNRELIKAVEAHKSDAQIFAKAQHAWLRESDKLVAERDAAQFHVTGTRRAFFEVVSERDAARANLVTASEQLNQSSKVLRDATETIRLLKRNNARDPITKRFVKAPDVAGAVGQEVW